MPRPLSTVPAYSRHKASNQAFCTVRLANGQSKDIYLGTWKSPASKDEYARIVALLSANNTLWCLAGVKLRDRHTLRLEHYRPAGRLMTSRAALVRFLAAQQQPFDTPDYQPRSPAERRRAADRELEGLGVK